MRNLLDDETLRDFYAFSERDGFLKIFFSMIFSLSFYIYVWIYRLNVEFSKIDEDAPNAERGVSVLVILPAFWFLIMYFLKRFILGSSSNYLLEVYWPRDLSVFHVLNLFIGGIEIVGWFLILFLILKYLYDFSLSFARFTRSRSFMWYLLLFPYPFGFVFLVFGVYSLWFFVFITIATVLFMELKMIRTQRVLEYEYSRRMSFRTSDNGSGPKGSGGD